SGSGMGFWPVAGLMLVWGGANYGLYTAALALIGDRFQAEKLTAAIAALAAVYALAAVIGPAVAGGMMDALGAQGLFGAVAVVYLAALCGGVYSGRSNPVGRSKSADVRDRLDCVVHRTGRHGPQRLRTLNQASGGPASR
ncbi:MFS transporter, partial [Mesorhizobium sp. M1A.F.Ca.IN.022.05.2.1]